MALKKKRVPSFSIYAVLDRQSVTLRPLTAIASDCLKAGIKIIQLRDKTEDSARFYRDAVALKKLIGTKALYIINDRIDIAKLSNADGVHLGQYDIPVAAARKILGPKAIVGKSCHSLAQALSAEKEGVDYISIGPVFSTPTKPDYKPVGIGLLEKVRTHVTLPVVAIGGITKDNIHLVRATNTHLIAVVRAIGKAKDTVKAVKELSEGVSYGVSRQT